MAKITKEIEGKVYELTNKGLGCAYCDLVSMSKSENGQVAECIEKTSGKCLNMLIPGLNFKLKK